MSNDENGEDQGSENVRQPRQKDKWDKLEILSKFASAILIVAIGILGNRYLLDKQKKDTNLKLYTQLLSNKETAENMLRKDMFVNIQASFLEPKPKPGEKIIKQMTLVKIRDMHLNLALVARNFHESVDMKPLFKHLLMEIIRPRVALKKLSIELKKCEGDNKSGSSNFSEVIELSKEAEILTNKEIMAIKSKPPEDKKKTTLDDKNKEVGKLLKLYDRELEKLIQTAKRVTRKQCEILEEVSQEIKLDIKLPRPNWPKKEAVKKESESKKFCQEYKPTDWLPKDGTCEKKGKGKDFVAEGVKTEGVLFLKDSNGKNDKDSYRYFSMKVRYIYPRWKQVYVEMLTCPVDKSEEKTINEQECFARWENDKKKNKKSAFWLEYFDFPLVDNTYINSKQRYSVILDDFGPDDNENFEIAKIKLLYYPASYSGLKEKSFYNNQLMRGLIKSDLFQDK